MANMSRDDVYELQRWLRTIAQVRKNIPLVLPDGIYGRRTAEAVSAFQQEYGLPVTGVVDFTTWNAIRDEYLSVVSDISTGDAVYFFPSADYITFVGEESDIVRVIQIILTGLSVAYDKFEEVDVNGIYDDCTSDCIKLFQEVNGLPITGVVDKDTWNKLARSYNTYANHPGYTS